MKSQQNKIIYFQKNEIEIIKSNKVLSLNFRVFGLIVFFIFDFLLISNGQTTYSLNDYSNFTPTNGSSINNIQNSLTPQFLDSTKKWISDFSFQASELGFSELKKANLLFSTNQFLNSIISLNCAYFGFDLSNEFSAGLSLNHTFGKLLIGGQISYNSLNIKEFQSNSLIKLDIFGNIAITEDYSAGFFVNNINRAYFSNFEKTPIQNAIISASYFNHKNFGVDIGTNLVFERNSYFFIAGKYKIFEMLSMFVRYNSEPKNVIGGIGLEIFDWFNFTGFISYKNQFGYDNTVSSEFIW